MADNENKIEVEIVLNDGSIQRGFVKMQAQAEKTAKGTEENFSDSFSKAAVAAGAITAALYVVKKAADQIIDSVKMAEQVEAVNRQFEDLAAQAGVTASVIRNDLVTAADGLVDDTDLLQSASKAFIELGSNAAKLPEIFDLARKASAFTGRDINEVFQQINSAIASGQTRALKQMGIFIDSDKVVKDYAKSLGIVPSLLTDIQRQQATLNAVLTQGEQKFKNIDPEKNEITNNLKRAEVAFGQLGEAADIAFKKLFGNVISTSAAATANFFGSMADTINSNFGDAGAKVKILNEQLEFFKQRLANANTAPEIAQIEKNLERVKKQLFEINAMKQADSDSAEMAAARGPKTDAEVKAAQDANDQILKNEAMKNAILQQYQTQADQAKMASLNSQLQNSIAFEETSKIQTEIDNFEKESAEKAHLDRMAAIKKQFDDLGIVGSQQQKDAELASAQKLESDKEVLAQRSLARERAHNALRLKGWSGFFGNLATLSESGSSELAAIGKAAALTQATIDGYAAVVSAYNFGSKFGPATAAAFAAAAGIAQAVNIAKIASVNAGGGGGSNFAPGSGGGIAGGSTETTGSPTTALQPAEVKPQTKIEVNIAGDIFDSEETGLRVVDLISKAYDQNGVVTSGRVV